MNCFVAGIVKGLKENGDPRRHFGSLLAFKGHLKDALDCGLVSSTERPKLTESGERYYQEQNLSALADTRSYFWDNRDWSVRNHRQPKVKR